jgi:hypothetical protein
LRSGTPKSGKHISMLKKFNTGIKKRYLIFGILIILPLVLLEIWSVNRLATLGVEINKLENSAASLSLENQVLQNEIAKRSALSQVEAESKLLGFEKVKTIQAVGPAGLALNH